MPAGAQIQNLEGFPVSRVHELGARVAMNDVLHEISRRPANLAGLRQPVVD